MPPELIVFFTAMIPYLDIKLAIPIGISFGLSAPSTFLFAVSGNIIPAAIFLALIGPISTLAAKHSKPINTFLEKIFNKTRKQHTKKFISYGALFIIAFVAIPIPGSGTITGSLIAFLFGVNYWKSLCLISIGAAIAGILVTTGSESFSSILNL